MDDAYAHAMQVQNASLTLGCYTYACLSIAGMSDKTLQWNLLPFSLTGKAKHWYKLTIGSR